MSITPRVLLLEVTSESRNQNSLPSLRTNHRRRQVRTTSPRFINHPARAGSRQNSTPPVSWTFPIWLRLAKIAPNTIVAA